MYEHDLENDMQESTIVKDAVIDDVVAGELYAALCNMRWYKIPEDNDAAIMLLLKKQLPDDFNTDEDTWSASWRGAGGIVADLRRSRLRKAGRDLEDYMDWYCNGDEGIVSDRILELLSALKWRPINW